MGLTNDTIVTNDAITSNRKKLVDESKPAIIDEHTLRDKIYVIRGQQVMLDYDLAAIYGYETKAFNQQVRRNSVKFDEDFRFQLTKEETEILRSQIVTSSWGGPRYLPWAFTEQGIYMLMTVLKGDLATRQSKALIRAFKSMKDYIVNSRALVSETDHLRLSMQVANMQRDMGQIRSQLDEHTRQLTNVMTQLDDTVRRSDLPSVFFDPVEVSNEYLILAGQPAKADETYIKIYSQAKQTIHIIDDYINIKTLRLLHGVQAGVVVTVFSDNVGNKLHASDVADFQTEFPGISISFQSTNRLMHDRFIVLDYGTNDERIFLCGTSSKDAGQKSVTAISEITDGAFKRLFGTVMAQLMRNPVLSLKYPSPPLLAPLPQNAKKRGETHFSPRRSFLL